MTHRYGFCYSENMLIRILSFFILFSVFGASFFAAQKSVSEHLESEESIAHNVHGSEDCSGDDCHDGDNCCDSFCSCAPSFIMNTNGELSFNNRPLLTKQHWDLYINYRPPFLYPALKPPLSS